MINGAYELSETAIKELVRWQRKSIKSFKRTAGNDALVEFSSPHIPFDVAETIRAWLSVISTREEIYKVFDRARTGVYEAIEIEEASFDPWQGKRCASHVGDRQCMNFAMVGGVLCYSHALKEEIVNA